VNRLHHHSVVFDGLAFDAPLDKKQDSLKRFADTYIHSGWQDQ